MFRRFSRWLHARARRRVRSPDPGPARDRRADPLPMLITMLAGFEGFRSTAYLCGGKVWTYGYGCTRRPSGQRVEQGDSITEPAARELLAEEATAALNHAKRLTRNHLPTPAALAAIASLIYNMGPYLVEHSHFLEHWKKGEMDDAKWHFLDFNKIDGVPSKGLTNRREQEWEVLTGKVTP